MVRTFGAMLRRRWRVIAVVAITCLFVGALWAAAQTPRYRSSVTLALSPSSLPDTGIAAPDVASLLTSPEVAAQVEAASGLAANRFDASLREAGNGLTIIVDAPDAALAQRAAQGFGDALTSTTARIGTEAATGFELRSPAQLPAEPFSPDLRTTALATGVLGFALGTAAAVVVERLRRPTTLTSRRRRKAPAPVPTVEPEAAVDPALAWFLELSRAASFDDDHFPSGSVGDTDTDAAVDAAVDTGRDASRPQQVAAGMPVADPPRIVAPPPLPEPAPTTSPAVTAAPSPAWPSADLPGAHGSPTAGSQPPDSHLPAADLAPWPPQAAGPSAFSSLVAPDPPAAALDMTAERAEDQVGPGPVVASQPGAFSVLVGDSAPLRAASRRSFSFSALALGEPDDTERRPEPAS